MENDAYKKSGSRQSVGKRTTREGPFYLREWLDHLDMSQRELADKTGYSTAQISQIINRNTPGSVEALRDIARALGISVGMLFDVKPLPGGRLINYWVPDSQVETVKLILEVLGAKRMPSDES